MAAGVGSAADPRAGLSTAVEAHATQIQDVLRAIAEDREPELSGQEARKAVEIILAIYASSREGRSVAVDTWTCAVVTCWPSSTALKATPEHTPRDRCQVGRTTRWAIRGGVVVIVLVVLFPCP